jgi:hypothetical protein
MKELKTLEEKAKVLAEKRTWVRKNVRDIMCLWEEKTKNIENIISDTPVLNDTIENYYLCTATEDPKTKIDGCLFSFNGSTVYFDQVATMQQLRYFLSALPAAIAEIEKKIDKETIELENLNDFFNKFK